jgi:hypothetical protein
MSRLSERGNVEWLSRYFFIAPKQMATYTRLLQRTGLWEGLSTEVLTRGWFNEQGFEEIPMSVDYYGLEIAGIRVQ